jgi:hypothetical protein
MRYHTEYKTWIKEIREKDGYVDSTEQENIVMAYNENGTFIGAWDGEHKAGIIFKYTDAVKLFHRLY